MKERESLCRSCLFRQRLEGDVESQKFAWCSNEHITGMGFPIPQMVMECGGYSRREVRMSLEEMKSQALIIFQDRKTGKIGFYDSNAFKKKMKEEKPEDYNLGNPLHGVKLPRLKGL